MNKYIKTNLLKVLCFVATLIICNNVAAQDPHFSQYFASPMTLNPSLIGKDVTEWRVSMNYRSQWWGSGISPFNTMTGSIEKRIALSKSANDNLAIGLMFLSDQSNNRLLKNNFVSLGVAYNKALNADGTEQIGAGLSGTYANRIFDQSKFQFQTQFGSMGFQREAPTNDIVVLNSNSYVEVNAGANYSKENKRNGYRVGAAYFHASKPKIGAFEGSTYTVDPRLSVQASGWMMLGTSKNQLHISTNNEFQGGFHLFTLGGLLKLDLNDDTIESLNVGAFKRFGDSFYPYVGIESKSWLAAISYDVVSSDLKSSYNSVQSLEFSIVYQFVTKKGAAKPNGRPIYY